MLFYLFIILLYLEPLGQRMAWAATFDSILSHRKNPRTDCPETLVPLPILSAAEHAQEVAIQRAKPLNHHLEAQIIFYCHANTATVEVIRSYTNRHYFCYC